MSASSGQGTDTEGWREGGTVELHHKHTDQISHSWAAAYGTLLLLQQKAKKMTGKKHICYFKMVKSIVRTPEGKLRNYFPSNH